MSDPEKPDLSFFLGKAKNYDKWYTDKNWDAILPMHTEDVILIPGGGTPAKGKEEMKKLLIAQTSAGFEKLWHTFDDYFLSGDSACCRGHFELKDKDDNLKGSGNTMVVYVRVNGRWLIHYDLFAMK